MHLYLMQSDCGLIKVGQSQEPMKRLIALRRKLRCDIQLLKVLENSAHLEEGFLIRLSRFKRIGEWFNGTNRVREVISELFGLDGKFVWPFAFDRPKADAWLDQIAIGYDNKYWQGVRYRVIRRMRRVLEEPTIEARDYASLEGLIECALDSDANQYGFSVKRKKNHGLVAVVAGRPIPCYTRDIKAALALLGEGEVSPDIRDITEHRDALALCIEVLCKRWGIGARTRREAAEVPRGPYRQTAEDRERTGSRHRYVFRR